MKNGHIPAELNSYEMFGMVVKWQDSQHKTCRLITVDTFCTENFLFCCMIFTGLARFIFDKFHLCKVASKVMQNDITYINFKPGSFASN